jgi:hypothetical protein
MVFVTAACVGLFVYIVLTLGEIGKSLDEIKELLAEDEDEEEKPKVQP